MVLKYLDYKIGHGELLKFIIENKFSNLELRLLLFWARHPHAKLSIYTIASAMDTARINLREAIATLVKKCVLEEQKNGCGITTYYLSSNEDMKNKVYQLSQMDWTQIKLLERQLEAEAQLCY